MNKRTILFLAGLVLISALCPGGGLATLQAEPSPSLQLYRQGENFMVAGKYFLAVQRFKEALEVNPSYLEPYIGLAEAFYRLGEWEEALSYVEAGKKLSRNHTALLNREGFIRLALRDFSASAEIFRQVLVREPNNLDARFGLAELDLADGKKQQAAILYLEALQVSPANKVALIHLISVYHEMGEPETAGTYLELALKQHSGDPQIHYIAGEHYFRLKNYPLAEKYLTTALALQPDYPGAWQLKGFIQIFRNQFDGAVSSLENSLTLENEFLKALSYYALGIATQRGGKIQEAITYFKQALRLRYDDEVSRLAAENLALSSLPDKDPVRAELAEYHFLEAQNYHDQNYLSKALNAYRRSLQLNPDNRAARINHATLYKTYGFPVKYYYALKVLQDYYKDSDRALEDELDIYQEILYDTVSARWNKTLMAIYDNKADGEKELFNQFNVEKSKYRFSIFTIVEENDLIHPLADEILTNYFRQLFLTNELITLSSTTLQVSSRGDAFAEAKKNGSEFYLILTYHEQERSLEVNGDLYLSRTGSHLKNFKFYRTGNKKLESAFYALANAVYTILPVRGKLITRNFNQGLINLGRLQEIKAGDIFRIVKKNRLQGDHKTLKYNVDEKDILGEFEVTAVDENLAQGTIRKKSFFDYINPGDDVLLVSQAEIKQNSEAAQ